MELKSKNIKIIPCEQRKQKTGYDLMKHFGVLKGDKGYDKIKKELKAAWLKWRKRYE